MFKEFLIARNLNHSNIVSYKNFITKQKDKLFEFNIILDYCEGGNLKEYNKNFGIPSNDKLRDFIR